MTPCLTEAEIHGGAGGSCWKSQSESNAYVRYAPEDACTLETWAGGEKSVTAK